MEKKRFWSNFSLSIKGVLTFFAIMAAATLLCALLMGQVSGDFHAPLIYILAVILISRLTKGFLYGIVAAIASVFFVNYAFTFPYLNLNFSLAGYPIIFVSMLAVSIITSAMTTQIKHQEKLRAEAARESTRANLLRAVSHDIRTPLTSIVGSTSALLENEDNLSDDEKRKLLVDARDEAEWLIRMVENLLSVTKVGADFKINKSPEIAEEILAEAMIKAEKRLGGIKTEVSVPDELLFIPMDAMLIEQVIINLAENAAIHAKGVTCIWISVEKHNDHAVFSVRDNGAGINEDDLKYIFSGYLKRPSEENTSADQKRNMGIGLSSCKAIVTAHGGEMTAENLPGGGALFKFTLPLEQEDIIYDREDN
ncbi:MAG: DUF4118 domain-containing protein [Oscillospiraceae bacterium]|nr:DUF4118 domain-containing protein [Oscillospiraceae bacterium]